MMMRAAAAVGQGRGGGGDVGCDGGCGCDGGRGDDVKKNAIAVPIANNEGMK